MLDRFEIFDSHLHIIDSRFPLVPNNGYLPVEFATTDYLQRTAGFSIGGGAVVSGSFQAFDQTYLIDALARLGTSYVGVTQLPVSVSDEEILRLHQAGVRAVRFNLRRGGSEQVGQLSSMAARVYEMLGWHVELYVDSSELPLLYNRLVDLPSVSIDHFGLSRSGLGTLTRLVEQGVRVKASGFSRVDFAVEPVLRDLYAANPGALMFGTDLPSTRAPRPFQEADLRLVIDTLDETAARDVLSRNAIEFYNLQQMADGSLQRMSQ